MKPWSVVVLGSLLFVMATGCSGEVETSAAKPGPQAPVENQTLADSLALATLQGLHIPGASRSGASLMKPLGFGSTDEMRHATLEPALAVYRVPMTSTSEFDEATDPSATLADTQVRFYPVVSGGTIVSGVTVSTAGSAPHVIAIGRSGLARSLSQGRAAVASPGGAGGEKPFAVELVGLDAWYVGQHDRGGALWLTAIRSDARLPGIVALQTVPARLVFAGLKSYAVAARATAASFGAMFQPTQL